jgi:hypothetical protein
LTVIPRLAAIDDVVVWNFDARSTLATATVTAMAPTASKPAVAKLLSFSKLDAPLDESFFISALAAPSLAVKSRVSARTSAIPISGAG